MTADVLLLHAVFMSITITPITERFGSLLARIEPSAADVQVYKKHRHTVTRRIKSAFATTRVELIGSYCRQSSIRHDSDIDLMPIIKVSEVQRGDGWIQPTTILNHFRRELQDRYTSTKVGRDGQAVVVRFKDGQHPVDVVPAVFCRLEGTNKYPVYAIPSADGNWIETSPQAHNKFIRKCDERSRGKLKKVAKLIRFWRSCRTPHIPLSVFHLEVLLAHEKIYVGSMSIPVCLNKAFALLASRDCRALRDPVGISGLVSVANTETKRDSVLSAVKLSANRAHKAVAAERAGDFKEAYRLWNLVFNHRFPKS